MTIRLGLLLSLTVLTGCSQHHDVSPAVRLDLTPYKIAPGMVLGLGLVVRNDSPDLLCFPTQFLQADNMEFKRNGVRARAIKENEYPGEVDGGGPFFMAGPHRTTMFQINTEALDMSSGKYSFHAVIGWLKCRDIDTAARVRLDRADLATINGSVDFPPPWTAQMPLGLGR